MNTPTENTLNRWEARYQSGETGWDQGKPSPALAHWLDAGVIRPGMRILVPGCGRGHEVIELAARGCQVTALDIAPTPVRELQENLAGKQLEADVLLQDLFSYQPDEPFDLVWEQTCLCAIDPDKRHAYAEKLAEWLKPGGIVLALFMQTGQEGGPPWHCDMDEMRHLFNEQVWQWNRHEETRVERENHRVEFGWRLMRKDK